MGWAGGMKDIDIDWGFGCTVSVFNGWKASMTLRDIDEESK